MRYTGAGGTFRNILSKASAPLTKELAQGQLCSVLHVVDGGKDGENVGGTVACVCGWQARMRQRKSDRRAAEKEEGGGGDVRRQRAPATCGGDVRPCRVPKARNVTPATLWLRLSESEMTLSAGQKLAWRRRVAQTRVSLHKGARGHGTAAARPHRLRRCAATHYSSAVMPRAIKRMTSQRMSMTMAGASLPSNTQKGSLR